MRKPATPGPIPLNANDGVSNALSHEVPGDQRPIRADAFFS